MPPEGQWPEGPAYRETILEKVDLPDRAVTEEMLEKFYRMHPHRRPVDPFSLPAGVPFEIDLSQVERTRWTPEEYGA
jgi:hypothetical protein